MWELMDSVFKLCHVLEMFLFFKFNSLVNSANQYHAGNLRVNVLDFVSGF